MVESKIAELNGLGGVGSQANNGHLAPRAAESQLKKAEAGQGPRSGEMTGNPVPSGKPEREPAELHIGSPAPISQSRGPAETYVRLRFDDDSKTVMVQVVSAATNEVIREIPPDAWERMRSGGPIPKVNREEGKK